MKDEVGLRCSLCTPLCRGKPALKKSLRPKIRGKPEAMT